MGAIQEWVKPMKQKELKNKDTINELFLRLNEAIGNNPNDYSDCVGGLLRFSGKEAARFYSELFDKLSAEQKAKWTEDILTSMSKDFEESRAVTSRDKSKSKDISNISRILLEIIAVRLDNVGSIKEIDRELQCLSRYYDDIKRSISNQFGQVKKKFTSKGVKLLLKCDTSADEWKSGAQPRLLSKFYCDLCEGMNDEIKERYRNWCEDRKLDCYLPALTQPQDDGDYLLKSLNRWMNERKEEFKRLNVILEEQKNRNAELSAERDCRTLENADLKNKTAELEERIRQLEDEKSALEQEKVDINRSLEYAQNEAKNSGNRALAGFKHDLARDIKAEIEDLSTDTARNDIGIMIELTDTLLQKLKRHGIPPEE
jgi:hypothetical protein